MSYFLGIDIGTSGTKTLLIDADGKVIAEANADYPLHQPKPGWTEQDPEDWWIATVKTVRKVVRQSRLKPADVSAIGLSGQMHGSVFLDKQDKVIRNALLWNDQRTSEECQQITAAAGGRKALIKMVANPALTGFQAPKILWLRNHEPRHFDKLAKVLLPKDDVRRRLIGDYVTEVSDASGTLLLDVVKRRWSSKLLGKLDLDRNLLPAVVESQQVTGTLTAQAAKALGLTTRCKVVGGAGDCAAGAIGNGVVKSGILSTSIGTSGVMFVHNDQPQYDAAGRLHTFCHAVDGKWHMMGVNLTSGGALQWWVDSVLGGLPGIPDGQRYEAATAEAAKIAPGSDGLLFLPYLNGERTPHADPQARGSFVGLNLTHSRGHLTAQCDGRGHVRAARLAANNQIAERTGQTDPCLRGRQQESAVATDASRRVRNRNHHTESRARSGLRGRVAGGGWRGSLQINRIGVPGHDRNCPANGAGQTGH